ncbi:MAG: SufD family Fe-S cluster assembly protein, partial [Pyrinomonadaceae bacterium]
MAQATKEKGIYHEAWESSQREAARTLPAWVVRLREEAFAAFERLGFPTTSAEDWKYTNVAPIARNAFAPAAAARCLETDVVSRFVYPEAVNSRLVFVDGVFSAGLSSLAALPAGVVVESLGDALRGEHGEVLRERVGRAADYNSDGFAALNAAFLEHGAFIHLPKGARLDAPLHLLFLSGSPGAQVVANPRVVVVAEEDSSATIIEDYQSAGGAIYFTNAVVEVFVGARARVAHFKVQDESAGAFHVATTAADIESGGAYDLTTITLG